MTQTEIAEFKLRVETLDASFDELQMLISHMVKVAAKEYRYQKACEKAEELKRRMA